MRLALTTLSILGLLGGCGPSVPATGGDGGDQSDRSDLADSPVDVPAPETGCLLATATFITDRGVYPEPALPALPAAGGTFADPTFGTLVMRVTDATDGADCITAYSYWPTFNRDATRFHVQCDGTAYAYRLDPATFTISGKQPLYSAGNPGLFWEDAIWSGVDPDVLFAHEGAALYSYDVATGVYTLVRDFAVDLPATLLWQMSRSLDDDVFAFTTEDASTYAHTGYVAWRRSTDTILVQTATPPDLDEVQVDKTGDWLVVKTGLQGAGVIEVQIVDLGTGMVTASLTDDGPDYAPGHSDNGHGIVVGADNWMNRNTFRQLATPHTLYSVIDFGSDWSNDGHLSMLGDDEGWVLLSLFEVGAHTPALFHDEVVEVTTDGAMQLRRLAHHRSVYSTYYDSPRANVSRDGCFVAFTSNWGGTARHDVFFLKVAP